MDFKIFSAIAAAVLLALGVKVAPADFAGGLFLGLSGAYAAMAVSKPEDRLGVSLTLFFGVIFPLVAAIAHQIWPFNNAPVQLIMFLAGMMSRLLARAIEAFGYGLIDRFRKLPDQINIPGTRNDNGGE
jgi:hypothetical protein